MRVTESGALIVIQSLIITAEAFIKCYICTKRAENIEFISCFNDMDVNTGGLIVE